MITFITWLRALAAIIITNSHYTGIYPTDLIANGGLLGDVIFFAVSGFCLSNIKLRFDRWYLKRILRIYPAVWIITAFYLLIGSYSFTYDQITVKTMFWWFLYPTNYHFVASIMVLYIPFYIMMKVDFIKANLVKATVAAVVIWFAVYIFAYDKSYYHIDTVREPMVRFLYMFAMLIGAYVNINKERYINNFKLFTWFMMALSAGIYFVSKLVFSKVVAISEYQIINQIILLVLLFFVFRCFAGLEDKLNHAPRPVAAAVKYLSETTLEIYVVQYGILTFIKNLNLVFPLNWLVLTVSILGLSAALHFAVSKLNVLIEKGMRKIA